jgi:endoglucanase
MAMAARVYRPFDESFAGVCLGAAERAWNWMAEYPEAAGFKNPPDILTGEYGDAVVEDEKYWAYAELFRTTGRAKYHDAFRLAFDQAHFLLYELGWSDVAGYGTLAYLLTGQSATNTQIYDRLMRGWIEQADVLRSRCERDGYHISLKPDEYIWGSNMVLLNQAMHLIFAERFSGEARYADAALNHLHYLLGQNPLCLSYVTGIGSNAVMNPHHRPSVGDGIIAPVPGMVAGGPNRGLQDAYAKSALEGKPPAKCFVDHKDSYSTNEMTIYWNSPAVFVAAYFDDASGE